MVPPPDYLAKARLLCDANDALLIVDEVQSGIGRTGHWFATSDLGVKPDVLTLAKGLGGGMPIGACLGFGAAATLLQPGEHGSTFGGNPVSAAAALAVLDTIAAEDLLATTRAHGRHIEESLSQMGHPLLESWRGTGLWWALVLNRPRALAVQEAAARAGFLVNAIRPDVVRIAPPLVITRAELDSFLTALPELLDTAGGVA